MKVLVAVCRYFVGILFIFSGFIKANDALGFAYKLEEYFAAFHIQWLVPAALFLAILICIFEMLLGFMLILGARIKTTMWLLFLMIAFFTFLTFYTAYYHEVTECGCFGDAIPMTAWQSFAKNIVLSTMILILFFQKKHIRPMLVKTGENVAVVIFALFSLGFPLYTYNYLPVLDFRPYKVGTNIIESTKGTPDVLKYFYTLKNKKTGETKEFDAWPKNWDTEWDYIGNHTKIVKKGIQAAILDFSISNVDGKDITDSILANPNYNFLLIEYDLAKSNLGTQNKINELANSCDKNHIKFAALTGSDNDQIKNFRHQENTMYPFYVTDGTDLKTMIRSNPGLILMKNGVIIAKWHFHSIPTFNKFNEKYLKGQ